MSPSSAGPFEEPFRIVTTTDAGLIEWLQRREQGASSQERLRDMLTRGIAAVWTPGTRSKLDERSLPRTRDVSATVGSLFGSPARSADSVELADPQADGWLLLTPQ